MASDPLDDVFNNIVLSEQESNAQQEYFQNLKAKIAETENEVKETEKLLRAIEENISKKIKHLANREVELLSLNMRKESLGECIKEMQSENKDLKKTMEDLKVKLKSSREKLCKDSKEFVEELGVFSNKLHTGFQPEAVSVKYLHATEKSKDCLTGQKEQIMESEDLWAFDVDFNNDFSQPDPY